MFDCSYGAERSLCRDIHFLLLKKCILFKKSDLLQPLYLNSNFSFYLFISKPLSFEVPEESKEYFGLGRDLWEPLGGGLATPRKEVSSEADKDFIFLIQFHAFEFSDHTY